MVWAEALRSRNVRRNSTTDFSTVLDAAIIQFSVAGSQFSVWHAGDDSGKHFLDDPALHACRPVWWKYLRDPGWSARCAGPHHFLPCGWRNCGATCVDWLYGPCLPKLIAPSPRFSGGSACGLLGLEIKMQTSSPP